MGAAPVTRAADISYILLEVIKMELDVSQYSCPNPECADYGKAGAGNIRIHCRKDKRLRCVSCSGRFSARQGTIFYNLKTDEEKILRALMMIGERCSARGTARALGTNEDTVLGWVKLAAQHADEVSKHLISKLNVTQLQLDELWSFVQKKRCRQKPA